MKFGIFIALQLFSWSMLAQSLNKVQTISGSFDFVRMDNFGKLYLVKGNEVKMYGPDGNFLSQNSDKYLGDITDIDATNGLELLVFFEDQVQILFLDNQLGLKGRDIPLEELGFQQVSHACNSYGNGVWLFDKVKFQLTRLDKKNSFTANSGNLSQLLGFSVDPIYMRESNNWLYLLDRKKGILVFDIYGAYYKTIPVTGIDYFQVSGNNLIHYKKPYVLSFNLKELETDTLWQTTSDIKQVILGKNRMNFLQKGSLDIMLYER
ncbi:MAG: hypothetical protein KDC83_12945 [Flavobacteriales bacterium]|nr:hypothetical protein [Flavobacteriales bacterium]